MATVLSRDGGIFNCREEALLERRCVCVRACVRVCMCVHACVYVGVRRCILETYSFNHLVYVFKTKQKQNTASLVQILIHFISEFFSPFFKAQWMSRLHSVPYCLVSLQQPDEKSPIVNAIAF